MRALKTIYCTGVSVALLLLATSTQSWAFGGVGGAVGSLGGESRGITSVTGRVLCAGCDLDDVQRSQPSLPGLYELHHRQGQVVMQLFRPGDASDANWWDSIVGLNHTISVRTPDYVFAQLMAEENMNRRVGIVGLLRPTRTYDVASVTFLESVRRPLSVAPAPVPAPTAAANTDDAVARAERAADRLEAASRKAEARFEEQLRK